MKDLGIWEPYSVKTQTYKTAVEVRSHTRQRWFRSSLLFPTLRVWEVKRVRDFSRRKVCHQDNAPSRLAVKTGMSHSFSPLRDILLRIWDTSNAHLRDVVIFYLCRRTLKAPKARNPRPLFFCASFQQALLMSWKGRAVYCRGTSNGRASITC